MVRNEGDKLTRAVVCTPNREYFRLDNLEEHNIDGLANPEIAFQQHALLKSTLAAFGVEVIDIPELDGHPNSVFTRDAALCTPEGYIKLRLGFKTRLGESKWMAQNLDRLGETLVGEIRAPGTVEGGDIVLAGQVAFIGQSMRTNEEGIAQLSFFLSKMGFDIRVVGLPNSILHLDRILMMFSPKELIYCSEFIPKDLLNGFRTIEISYGPEATANSICLGNNAMIVDCSNHVLTERLQAENVVVHKLDLSEFAKGMGGPNCLIMPVERSI